MNECISSIGSSQNTGAFDRPENCKQTVPNEFGLKNET